MVDSTDRKVLLYIGKDLSELLIANKLIPQMIGMGVKPVLLFVDKAVSKNPDAYHPDLKEFGFYHSDLIQDTILPFLDSRDTVVDAQGDLKSNICYTPKQLAKQYGLELRRVKDVNSSSHLKSIQEDNNIVGAVSLRCTQIFKNPIISIIQSKGFMWNVHPGKLPAIRGVLPVYRAVEAALLGAGSGEIRHTIHSIIDDTIDTGPIHASTSQEIDLQKSVLYQYNNNASAISALVSGMLNDTLNGIEIGYFVQDHSQGHYSTYPSSDALRAFNEAGGSLVDSRKKNMALLTNAFMGSIKGSTRLEFVEAICQAISKKFDSPDPESSKLVSRSMSLPAASNDLVHINRPARALQN